MTQEEFNIELYKREQFIKKLQDELENIQTKYNNTLKLCLKLKCELKRSNIYCDKLLHKKDMYKHMYLKEMNEK